MSAPMAVSSSTPSGSMPFSALRRIPLAELPLRNYIDRPPSPVKSYSSPGKIQPAILASPKPKSHSPSPSRPSSIHLDLSSRHQLFREAIRKGGSSSSSENKNSPNEEENKFTSPKVIKPTSVRQLSTPSSTSQSPLLQRSPLLTSPQKKASTTVSAPQSLGKKKDRIRRQLLDEDEEGGADVDIRAGSPSPAKMKAERGDALRGPSSSSTASQVRMQKEREVLWTVWRDEDEGVVKQTQSQLRNTISSVVDENKEEDKENMKPVLEFVGTTGRKKGTGGRLSLLATGDDTVESEHSVVDMHDKRRRVTPIGPAE